MHSLRIRPTDYMCRCASNTISTSSCSSCWRTPWVQCFPGMVPHQLARTQRHYQPLLCWSWRVITELTYLFVSRTKEEAFQPGCQTVSSSITSPPHPLTHQPTRTLVTSEQSLVVWDWDFHWVECMPDTWEVISRFILPSFTSHLVLTSLLCVQVMWHEWLWHGCIHKFSQKR